MKIQFILIASMILSFNQLSAQHARFIKSGEITYEKTVNQHAIIKRMNSGNRSYSAFNDDDELNDYLKNIPQFKKLQSTLKFSDTKTLFTPIAESQNGMSMIGPFAEQANIVYTDLAAKTFTTEKNFFDEIFLLKDSTKKIIWKLTSEMRDIAGYECRRANAVIMDSIYVVAFYTDRIPVLGGPESFTGLPGMILGVALPHDNVTWFAKSVTDKPIPSNEVKAPVKGKPTSSKELHQRISKLAGDRKDPKTVRMIKILLL